MYIFIHNMKKAVIKVRVR